MNVRLRMYEYCYSNLGAIYAKGLYLGDLRLTAKAGERLRNFFTVLVFNSLFLIPHNSLGLPPKFSINY